ncbi:MAG: thiamine-phosphate kinase [Rhodospirillaceae bacterium]|nr:thiamine-phosphate kinase [Rhodospirillaceae bacterium]
MDEFSLIRDLLAPLTRGAAGAYGLGDDAATIAPRPGCELVVTVDAVVGGVHFRTDDPPGRIAQKAARVNLSDLAAKGADPVGLVMALGVPVGTTDTWLRAFVAGLADDLDHFGVPLLGGDTTSTPGPLTVSITAFGNVPVGAMIRRSGAQAGDLLCVSGTIGDAVLGLASDPGLPAAGRTFARDRYLLPRPRLALGHALRGIAHAAIDVSDGLVADIGHMCAQSGVAAEIEAASVPLSDAGRAWLEARGDEALRRMLTGGDDYEIAFTMPAARRDELPSLVAQGSVPVSIIGRITAGNGVKVRDAAGGELAFARSGYRHLQP